MKRLIYLIAIIPFIAHAQPNTVLGSLPAGNVAVNYTSYPRGYLYPVFSISGGDTLMQINYSNYKVSVSARGYTHYLQGDVTGKPPFPSMDSVIKWMNINFLLNAGIQINNIYDSLAVSQQALADSCDTLRTLIAAGGSGTLQTVTNAGNTTTNGIIVYNGSTSGEYDSVQSKYTKTIGMSSSVRDVYYDYFTANRNDTLPDESGMIMLTKDSTIYASTYFVTSSIHDSLPNLSGYFPTADTTYLFRKADSNTKGHAATFNLVADTAAVLRGLIPSGTMVNSITATAPVTVSAPTGTVNIGMPQSSGSVNGYLSSSDWSKFDGNRIGAFFTSIPYSILNTSMSVTVIATTTQTITGWYVCGDQSGSITVGLTDNGSDMISTGNHPLLSSAQTNNAAVSGWTSTTITAGHVYKFTISGIISLQSLSVQLTTTL